MKSGLTTPPCPVCGKPCKLGKVEQGNVPYKGEGLVPVERRWYYCDFCKEESEKEGLGRNKPTFIYFDYRLDKQPGKLYEKLFEHKVLKEMRGQ